MYTENEQAAGESTLVIWTWFRGSQYAVNMKRISKAKLNAVRELVRQHAEEYQERFGIGPCGAIAVVLARAGWGKMAIVESAPAARQADEFAWYPHYVVVGGQVPGPVPTIMDVCGEYMNDVPNPVYRDLEFISEAEILEPCAGNIYTETDVEFWQAKLGEAL